MTLTESIKNLNKRIEPYYLLILMLVFLFGGFTAIYKLIFAPPELLVTVEKETINYPSSLNKEFVDLYNYIQKSTSDESIKQSSSTIYQYLTRTRQQWILGIKNNTNKTIRSINIRLANVNTLTSWAVSSSYLLEEEKKKLMGNIDFQKTSGIIYLKDAVNLPPNADLKFYLWGEFNSYSWEESLIINYDGGVAKIEYPKSFTGLKAILAEYFFEVVIFLIATFILVYLLQIRKYVDNKKDINQPN